MPVTVQILAALLVLKVKAVSPLEAAAVRVMGDAPKVTGEAGAKVTVWLTDAGMSVCTGRKVGKLLDSPNCPK